MTLARYLLHFVDKVCTTPLQSGKKWNFQKIRSRDYFVRFQYEIVYIKMAQNCKKSISTIMGKYTSAYRTGHPGDHCCQLLKGGCC